MLAIKERHEVLRRFEMQVQETGCTVSEYIDQSNLPIPPQLQLELIGIALEFAFRSGSRPRLDTFTQQLPQYGDRISEMYVETATGFLRDFCPVSQHKAKFPIDFGDYELIDEIGRGGMGVVYEAVQKKLRRRVAIKVLFFSREEILEEAKLLAMLNHPSVCRVLRAGEVQGTSYMAMELVLGRSLTEEIGKRIYPEDAVAIAIQLADGLAAVHRKNIAHLDVKPANVVIDRMGCPVLLDFGLAHPFVSLLKMDGSKSFGTTAYSAPECLSSQFGPINFQSDVYSLGLILYELITGRRPYHGTPEQILSQMELDPPRRLTDYNRDVDPELEQICLSAIEVKQWKRTATMVQLRDDLIRWQEKNCNCTTDKRSWFPRTFIVRPR